MKGAPRILGAQEYTSQLKNRIVSKSVPQAADQKNNTVATSILANRSNRVVKLLSDPTKSCSGGWTDRSDCCTTNCTSVAEITFLEFTGCQCSAFAITVGCPGSLTLFPFACPKTTVRITIGPDALESPQSSAFILVSPTTIDLSGMTAEVDGIPMAISPGELGGDATISGEYTNGSIIVLTFPTAITELSAFCPGVG
jgi:hypothetical protein